MSAQKIKIHGYYNLKIAMLLTMCVLAWLICFSYGQSQKIFVIFRYDDFSSLSQTDFEMELINLFNKFQISLTVGIIPYVAEGSWFNPSSQKNIPLSEEKIFILRRAILENSVEPALHGYSHRTKKDDPHVPSEFSGASYEEQLLKIKKGKIFLENVLNQKINIFIPPWNTDDENTLRCLEELGIECVSSSFSGTYTESSKLYFIPYTTKFPELLRAINSARRSSCPFPVIVVYFHEYEFKDVDSDFPASFDLDDLNNSLSWISSQQDIQITSMNKIIKEYEFETMGFKNNKANYKLCSLLPPFIIHFFRLNTGVYFCEHYLEKTKVKTPAVFLVYILFIFFHNWIFFFYNGKVYFYEISRHKIYRISRLDSCGYFMHIFYF